jgi:polysaccharide deacetylase family protein (PEP-CTERM system associated)
MNILTFHLEDWFHRVGIPAADDISKWDSFPSKVENYAKFLMDFLEERNQKASFFVLGWTANKYPHLVKELIEKGHEIAVHSYNHQLIYKMDRQTFREDTKRAISTIEDISGIKMRYYRAPGYSAMGGYNWFFEELAECGLEGDSSIFTAARSHGGSRIFPANKPCIVQYKGNRIKEFPISSHNFLGQRFVYSGGEYFRLFPYRIIKMLTSQTDYTMAYFRLREFDKSQPHLSGLGPLRLLTTYLGLGTNKEKLSKWINDFKFITLGEANNIINWEEVNVVNLTLVNKIIG